ncbi:class I adenylate-forming enzyme family protein [Sphingomonas sp. ID0503]|uniref:class I adenylate-forming enzyme family protein n=1 Tax=Sphingomonas sp. ID0503 TaxID=3399691 RepID=UPI003AFAB526
MPNRVRALLDRATGTPDAVALVVGDTRFTFAQMASEAGIMAARLAAHGIKAGSHVGILHPASADFIIVQQALFWLGAIVTPINILYKPAEIRHAVACCRLDYLATSPQYGDALGTIEDCIVLATDGLKGDLSDQARFVPPPVAELQEADPAMLLLTSATTGKAKGVILTVGNLSANYDATPAWLGLGPDTVILCALPLYNTFGLNQCINAMLVTGCRMVLLPRFDAEKVIAKIAEHGCTFLPAVPTMLQKLLDHPAASEGTLGSLRTIMTGGAPVPSALLQRLLRVAPRVKVLTGYGLTEATALVTLTHVELDGEGGLKRGRTIGRVLHGMELAIVDEEGGELAAGADGEIVIRGPNVTPGYFEAPEDTTMALRGGWLRTGDIGHVDEDGYAYIVDRKKDVIIRGGQNIYPADVEEVLYQVPGVAEAAVVAAGDEILGEVPIAYVALSVGSRITADRILECCRASLASYKVPTEIHLREELPKGPTGKILRRALRTPSALA